MKTKTLAGVWLFSICLAVLGLSCKKESTPTTAQTEKVDPSSAKPQSSEGNFVNGPYGSVKGNARIYLTDGRYQLALENFSTTNGPDLKVYISKETDPRNFINLGSLKSTNGDQLYNIPDGVNIKDYGYALIYCKQFSHLFGSAILTY